MQRNHSDLKNKSILIFIAIILFSFLFDPVLAQEKRSPRYVLTSDGKLNVREKPKDGKVLFQVEKGEIVFVNEESQWEEWPAITTKSGAKGYAAAEFLGKKSIEELRDAKLFGSLDTDIDGSSFRTLAIRIKNQWVSANDHSAEASYLEKQTIQTKEKAIAYKHAGVIGEFSPEKRGNAGCQGFRVLRGNLPTIGEINTLEDSVFGIFGSKISDKVKSDRYKPIEKISKLLDSSVSEIFKKKHPRQTELKFLKQGDFYKIHSPAKQYIFIRYAIKMNMEVEEKSYYAALYEFKEGELGKKTFEKFDVLSQDQEIYGGQYHFINAFDLDENGTPILIIHHSGYDGYIHEFYRIKNDKMESMFSTGGDAC
ncbi:SH3 domain-containing protein [Leptospira sp. WS92.C1]